MRTYVFQFEVEIEDDQDIQPAVKRVLESAVQHLSTARQPGQDPPFRLTVIDLGWKDPIDLGWNEPA